MDLRVEEVIEELKQMIGNLAVENAQFRLVIKKYEEMENGNKTDQAIKAD